MANAEIEKTLKKIADTLETNERAWNKRFDNLLTLMERHEHRLGRVEDTQLVHARLLETHERESGKRFDSLEARSKNLEHGAERLLRAVEKVHRVAVAHEQRLDGLHDEVRTLVASMNRLIKMIEDFAKGRKQENGRRR